MANCPSCGRPYGAGVAFCPGCGEALATGSPAAQTPQQPTQQQAGGWAESFTAPPNAAPKPQPSPASPAASGQASGWAAGFSAPAAQPPSQPQPQPPQQTPLSVPFGGAIKAFFGESVDFVRDSIPALSRNMSSFVRVVGVVLVLLFFVPWFIGDEKEIGELEKFGKQSLPMVQMGFANPESMEWRSSSGSNDSNVIMSWDMASAAGSIQTLLKSGGLKFDHSSSSSTLEENYAMLMRQTHSGELSIDSMRQVEVELEKLRHKVEAQQEKRKIWKQRSVSGVASSGLMGSLDMSDLAENPTLLILLGIILLVVSFLPQIRDWMRLLAGLVLVILLLSFGRATGGFSDGVYLARGFPELSVLGLTDSIVWGLLFLAVAGKLRGMSYRYDLLVRVLAGVGVVIVLLALLLPQKLGMDSKPLVAWLFDAASNINDEEALLYFLSGTVFHAGALILSFVALGVLVARGAGPVEGLRAGGGSAISVLAVALLLWKYAFGMAGLSMATETLFSAGIFLLVVDAACLSAALALVAAAIGTLYCLFGKYVQRAVVRS